MLPYSSKTKVINLSDITAVKLVSKSGHEMVLSVEVKELRKFSLYQHKTYRFYLQGSSEELVNSSLGQWLALRGNI